MVKHPPWREPTLGQLLREQQLDVTSMTIVGQDACIRHGAGADPCRGAVRRDDRDLVIAEVVGATSPVADVAELQALSSPSTSRRGRQPLRVSFSVCG